MFNLQKIIPNGISCGIKYLLYLFIFLLPWQTRWIIFDPRINNQVWEYGRISLYSFDIIFFIIFFLFLIKFFAGKRKEKIEKINWKLVIIFITLFLYYFISFVVADNKLINFYWFLRIIQGVFLVLILYKINLDKIKAVWVFILSVSLSAILGISQFLTQSVFACKWLGLASHSAGMFGDSVVEFAGERWLRAYGSFPHPNILAGFLIIALILIFQFLIPNIKILKYKLLSYFLTLLLITSLFFTFSRASWLVFAIVILLSFYYLIKNKSNKKNLLFYYFITLLLLIIFCIIYFPLVKTRIIGTERLEVKSSIERMSAYGQAFKIISATGGPASGWKNNLWLGTGLGNYTVELQKIYPNRTAYFYQPAHNVYLLVLAEIGVIGVIFIVLLLYYLVSSVQCSVSVRILQYKGLFLCFYILFFLFFFDHFWYTLPSGLLVVFLIFGFLKQKKEAPSVFK
ncbi:MAG: O-antigen ligase family protein [Patescibacteria group bacterium]